MIHNLKLNLTEHENKIKATETPTTDSIPQIKTETHVKLLNTIGLVQKEYIQGVFEDSYELKEKIGEGAHATVYRCIQKSSGKVFAVKITKQGDE
jgi:serine/threonine protein kinase